ncbi:MAG: serine/threonine protein phosphatase [Chromatiaceae bacterium]|nr:serine/threonine protein phosphatase [Chromatiaceae bacterium]MBP6733319.1 serine/threonine protein phosphatase [Chromatiaceae bacterium]MBP6806813.1 serine/threonine protein phosphatase [Chromatiaceae bacterium]MBP8282500.1 serine/threonine protein phosphatase [Chromatiaceae bacterium]MBP8288416.1 serine/threonine protein phosphatase [Chromatiaceae bacterium]
MTTYASPLVVIGDLHGHLDLFERLLALIDAQFPQARIVTLGDYVDNGPQIPALLDRLIALQAARPERFLPILGNHDLALLRALGWPGDEPDPAWYHRWGNRYWNSGLGTPQAYGARDLASFARAFPTDHRRFLAELPWYYDDEEVFCVHAGLELGAIGPQRAALEKRHLPAEPTRMPAALRDKDRATRHDPAWERLVVSGHTHLPEQPVFAAARRLCISATADHGGGLLAVLLPERRCWWTGGGPPIPIPIPIRN